MKFSDRIIALKQKCLRCWADEVSDIHPRAHNMEWAAQEMSKQGNPEHTCEKGQTMTTPPLSDEQETDNTVQQILKNFATDCECPENKYFVCDSCINRSLIGIGIEEGRKMEKASHQKRVEGLVSGLKKIAEMKEGSTDQADIQNFIECRGIARATLKTYERGRE